LPALPVTLKKQENVSTAAGSWLDSNIREGKRFRHAIAEGNFAPGPAADAALWMDWLAGKTPQPALATRLRTAAQEAISIVSPTEFNAAAVGHVRYPAPELIYGHVAEATERARQAVQNLLETFDSDLSVKYHPRAGGPDYGKTHSSNESNGFTSR